MPTPLDRIREDVGQPSSRYPTHAQPDANGVRGRATQPRSRDGDGVWIAPMHRVVLLTRDRRALSGVAIAVQSVPRVSDGL